MTEKKIYSVAFVSSRPDKVVIQEFLKVENLIVEEIRCKGIVNFTEYANHTKRRYEIVVLSAECACGNMCSIVTAIKNEWDASVIVISRKNSPDLEKEARNAGVLCYLTNSERQYLHEVIQKTIDYQSTRIE